MDAKQKPFFPWLFVGLTFLVSWALWIPAALSGKSTAELPTAPLYLLGGFGPSLVGVLLMLRADRDARRDFWRRAGDFSRIRPVWYLLIFLFIPAVTAAAFGLDALLGGGPYNLPNLTATFTQPAALFATLIIGILAGPLSEELGWRGYALDRVQARLAPLPAALLLGVIWWAWHLPLFFIRGTSHNTWGLFSPLSLLFLLNVLPLSVFISWAYNHNRRSTLAAILIHFMFNFVFSLIFPLPFRVELFRVVLTTVAVAAIGYFSPPPRFQTSLR